jgi:hypothetical protein
MNCQLYQIQTEGEYSMGYDDIPVHELPSGVIYCVVAPAARMPLMAAWLRLNTRV